MTDTFDEYQSAATRAAMRRTTMNTHKDISCPTPRSHMQIAEDAVKKVADEMQRCRNVIAECWRSAERATDCLPMGTDNCRERSEADALDEVSRMVAFQQDDWNGLLTDFQGSAKHAADMPAYVDQAERDVAPWGGWGSR